MTTYEKQNALLHRALIASAIENAVKTNPRIKPSAVTDIINKAATVFTVVETGQGNVKLIPKIGSTVLYGPDGTTPHSPELMVGRASHTVTTLVPRSQQQRQPSPSPLRSDDRRRIFLNDARAKTGVGRRAIQA